MGCCFDSGQSLGDHGSFGVELGDLDGDGDLDAFEAGLGSNRIWINEGASFIDSGQLLGDRESTDVALGDVDGDGDLDAVVGNRDSGNQVWLNSAGVFTVSGQSLGANNTNGVALGDLDGDGDLDAITANGDGANRVWLNEAGVFIDSGQNLGSETSTDVSLGDLDGDGDLDAIFVNVLSNRIWLNDTGHFTDSGQVLGDHNSRGVALGDLDADGDLDAVVANYFDGQSNHVWLNYGGEFVDSGQTLGDHNSYGVSLGDLDGDGDLDAIVANSDQGNRIWLNRAGVFSDSGQHLGTHDSLDVTLGDVDGDGDLDAMVVNISQGNRVWLNQSATFSVSPRTLVLGEGNSGLTRFVFEVTREFDTRGAGSIDISFAPSGSDPAEPDDLLGTFPDGTLDFPDGVSSRLIAVEVVGDTVAENDEEFTLVLSNPVGVNATIGSATAVATIRNDDNVDLGDLPAPFATLLADNGPAHAAIGPTLGSGRDTEADGQPSAAADGDDTTAAPDEDGVSFAATIFAGQLDASLTATASEAALLDGWIDFDGDGTFSGAREQVFVSAPVQAGSNTLDFVVPPDARVGETFARFRLSSAGGLAPIGGAADGEVEDYRLSILPPGGVGRFDDSDQNLGDHSSFAVSLGDVDGDGDLDAFVAALRNADRIWLNDGGTFSDSGQTLGDHQSGAVALGDLDGDGDLDAFVAQRDGGNRIWQNDNGTFSDTGQLLSRGESRGVALGDLDGDGDLDAIVANLDGTNRIWLNELGTFSDNGQTLGSDASVAIALGDLDRDGDLDAFVANDGANSVWLNEDGRFTDSRQQLGDHDSSGVSLGDLDGDGDLDAFVANYSGGEANRIWLNDGGVFTDSGQMLGDHRSYKVALGDLDGDGDLDAFSVNSLQANRIWTNDAGQFEATGQSLGDGDSLDVALGDLDGDGDLDALVANFLAGDRVWLNQVPVPRATLEVDETTIPEANGVATVTVTLSEVAGEPVTVELGFTGTATAEDFAASATQVVIAAGATSGSVTVTAVQDTADEADETVVVDISSVVGGKAAGEQQVTITITDDDERTGLVVTSLSPTSTGFVAEFSGELETSSLNLFGSPTDVVLQGQTSGPVSGSLVVGASATQVTFIRTAEPLTADTYTVRLRSGADAFQSVDGFLLDGDDDGTAGDDFVTSFTVDPSPPNTITVDLPDFVRGPGQDVNLPVDSTNGIPLSLSDGTDVRAVDLQIRFDSQLLEIVGATVADGMPAGAAVTLDTSTAGLAVVNFTSPSALPEGRSTLVNLLARVPTANANAIYRSKQVLDLHSVSVRDAGANPLPVLADDAIHVSMYLGDASGNGRINAADASRVARVAALLETGFPAARLADPTLTGDVTRNGRINASDAATVARFGALLPAPQIPPVPFGVVTTPITGGPDPRLRIPRDLTAAAAGSVTVPVYLDSVIDLQAPHRLAGVDAVIRFDPNVLTVTSITAGGFVTRDHTWAIFPNVDNESGRIVILAFTGTPVAGVFSDVLVDIHFAVSPTAPSGATAINLVASDGAAVTDLLDEQDGFLTLDGPLTNAPDDPVDGLLTIYANTGGWSLVKHRADAVQPGHRAVPASVRYAGTRRDDGTARQIESEKSRRVLPAVSAMDDEGYLRSVDHLFAELGDLQPLPTE